MASPRTSATSNPPSVISIVVTAARSRIRRHSGRIAKKCRQAVIGTASSAGQRSGNSAFARVVAGERAREVR